jgi:hypothetical protein
VHGELLKIVIETYYTVSTRGDIQTLKISAHGVPPRDWSLLLGNKVRLYQP